MKLKRPTWVTIVGVLAIIFGLIGVATSAQEMLMPSMMEMQKDMMANIGSGSNQAQMTQMFESMQEQFKVPDWYKTAAPIMGGISMLISGAYLLAGAILLMMKTFAVKMFYCTIAISILWAAVQIPIFSQSESAMLMMQVPVSVISIVIDVVLLLIVLLGKKSTFFVQEQINLPT